MSSVLITGANGFVGSALCSYLKDRGHHVVGVVRDAEKLSNRIADEYRSVGDISESTDWAPLIKGVDYIVHLAARVHIMNVQSDAERALYYSVNTKTTEHLAQAAIKAGVKRLLYLSSIKVNGECTESEPFQADDIPAPSDDYAKSKCEAESILARVTAGNMLEYVIIRPPLVYGQGVKGNIRRLYKLIALGLPLPLAGINNKRDMVSLNNLCSLIGTCINHPRAGNEVFLVSDGESLSTPAFARLIANAMGRSVALFSIPVFLLKILGRLTGKSNEIFRLTSSLEVDIDKTKKLLDWNPELHREEEFSNIVKFFNY